MARVSLTEEELLHLAMLVYADIGYTQGEIGEMEKLARWHKTPEDDSLFEWRPRLAMLIKLHKKIRRALK